MTATSGRNTKPVAPIRMAMDDSIHPGVAINVSIRPGVIDVDKNSKEWSSKQEKHNAIANCQRIHALNARIPLAYPITR